ncbi:MAG: hypothetical protein GC150_17250 [Rhizobiales bacterium]|nr:hypothetical protein [Hyphomicrobiales bacterium]
MSLQSTLGPTRPLGPPQATAAYVDQVARLIAALQGRPATAERYDATATCLKDLSRVNGLLGRHQSAIWRCAEAFRLAAERDPCVGLDAAGWSTVHRTLAGVTQEMRIEEKRRAQADDPPVLRDRRLIVTTSVLTTLGDRA